MSKIKKFFFYILNHQFFAGSMVMIIGSNFFNLGQFVYHFLTGRLLGKALYGDLAAVISFLGIIGMIHGAIGSTITKFIASEKDERKLNNFISWVYKLGIYSAIFIAILIFVFSSFIASFLNIVERQSFLMIVPVVAVFIVVSTGRSIQQGLLKFNSYIASLIAESLGKIIFGSVIILLGYKLFGALFGIFIGTIFALIITHKSISRYLLKKGAKEDLVPFLRYSFVFFVQGLALTSLYSMDLLLAKHFLSPEKAGIYASLNVLGRIVFFGISPITQVMFPLVAKKYKAGEAYFKLFNLSLGLIILMALGLIAVFFFFPKLPILALYGKGFLEGEKYLYLSGILMSLIALSMHFGQFFLSIGRIKVATLFVLSAFLQIILIWFYHKTIDEIIIVSIFNAALLLISLLLYFLYLYLKSKRKT